MNLLLLLSKVSIHSTNILHSMYSVRTCTFIAVAAACYYSIFEYKYGDELLIADDRTIRPCKSNIAHACLLKMLSTVPQTIFVENNHQYYVMMQHSMVIEVKGKYARYY